MYCAFLLHEIFFRQKVKFRIEIKKCGDFGGRFSIARNEEKL
jgi:hypothetical protein